MIKIGAFGLSTLALVLMVGCSGKKQEAAISPVELDTLERKMSYLIGYSAAKQIDSAGMELDKPALLRAMKDVRAKQDLLLSQEEMHLAGVTFQNMQREMVAANARKKNVDLGREYLTANAKRPEVTQTSTGLQYEVLKAGSGVKPKLSDTVRAHFHGTLLNGKVFESSVDQGEAITFPVAQVIPGWTEALQMMQVGAKWRVSLPYTLAYPNGTRDIEPGSALIFELELLDIVNE